MAYDILVVGGGIGGMEAALKLGDMGYQVLLVEKEPSIGGKMILLSKVFPTLDCASCISTPKMAATAYHPKVKTMVYSEVRRIQKEENGRFRVLVRQNPTFVDPSRCIGCRQCEMNCNVAVPDQYDFGLVGRRAAFIAFPQAVPKKAVIEREGTSPCSFACPAGIKAHGYVALVRSGKYDEAFNLVLETTPLVGCLGRTCFAPCEGACTRGKLEGPLPIRKLKRFVADQYYAKVPAAESRPVPNGPKVAVVGSGPAGLTCAWHLGRNGYRVKIFEAAPRPGGMLRLAIPSYRLPKDVVERDIQNLTAVGVEMETGTRIGNPLELKEQGYAAVFIATGTQGVRNLGLEGESLDGVTGSLDFLRAVNLDETISLAGKTVVVVGGGPLAEHSARVAVRLGAGKVILQHGRSRAAEKEGVETRQMVMPQKFTGENGKLTGVVSVKTELGPPDPGGRRPAVPVAGSECFIAADLVISAAGLSPETESLRGWLELNPNGTVKVDPATLQTSVPYIFAGGDVVTGPSMIARAVGQGRRAAFFIDRYLKGESLSGSAFDRRLPVVDKKRVLQRQEDHSAQVPVGQEDRLEFGVRDFTEVEAPLTEEQARYSAGRCLDCGVCSECGQCVTVCPAGAIDLGMRAVEEEVEVASVIVSTGFKLFPARMKAQYGYGVFKNVITGMQMDRLLAPTKPYNAVLRPYDGKVPSSIAYILCTGSRDQLVGNPLCSRVCCMYSVKQNQLIMGALPLADVTVYYIDVRAFGKGYEEFYQQARAMGANFVKGRVGRIEEKEGGDLVLHYEDIDNGGAICQAEHDLVVLAVGLLPNTEVFGLFPGEGLAADEYSYVKEVDEDISPGKTSIDGVFVAGTAAGARDIPDTILHAGAAAASAAAFVERVRSGS